MRFLVKFVVDEPAVGPTLAALNSHDGVVFEHLSIEPLPEFKALPKPGKPGRDAALNRIDKAEAKPTQRQKSQHAPMQARDHVLKTLASRTATTAQLHELLRGFGFGGSGSTLRNLRDDGLIEKVGGQRGVWRLTQGPKAEEQADA